MQNNSASALFCLYELKLESCMDFLSVSDSLNYSILIFYFGVQQAHKQKKYCTKITLVYYALLMDWSRHKHPRHKYCVGGERYG